MKNIPAGKYSVQPTTALAVQFPLTEVVGVDIANPLKAGRVAASGKPAKHDWATLTLETENGNLIVDGLRLAKQCTTDEKLRKACFKKFEASEANGILEIEEAEFKAGFTIGLTAKGFIC